MTSKIGRPSTSITPAITAAVDWYKAGHTLKACADKFGITQMKVYYWASRMGVSRPAVRHGKTGAKHGRKSEPVSARDRCYMNVCDMPAGYE